MGNDVSRSDYEAILIPDFRITKDQLWAAQSSYDEDAPQVGPITADDTSDAVIEASGTLTNGDALYLRTLHAGMPGINRAGFGWRSSTANNWFGWDVPCSIAAYEGISGTAGSDSLNFHSSEKLYPSVISLSSGALLIASDSDVASTRQVRITYRAWESTTWSTDLLGDSAATTTGHHHPRLVLLPTGRALLFYFVYDDDNSEAQVALWYSDDPTGGESTWVEGARAVLPDPISTATNAPERLRVAYNPLNGQILMLIRTASSTVSQYASRDLGTSFTLVKSGLTMTRHDITVADGVFVVGYSDASLYLEIYRTGSAFTDLSTLTAINATSVTASSEIALATADDGTVYACCNADVLGWGASADGGVTWLGGWPADGGVSWSSAGGVLFADTSATWHRGRIYLVGNQSAPAADTGEISAAVLGGYSTVTLPPERRDQNIGRQAWWASGWVGHDSPAVEMTDSSAGAPVLTRNNNGSWAVVTGAADTGRYDNESGAVHTITSGEEHVIRGSWAVNSGVGSLYNQWTSASDSTQVQVRLTTTALTLRDVNGGSQIGSSVSITAGTRIDVKVAVNGQNAACWYRTYTIDGPRTWTLLASTTSLTLAGAAASYRARFEVTASSDVDLFERFRVGGRGSIHSRNYSLGHSLADGIDTPAELFARPLPALGTAYVSDGAALRGRDGPTLRGETFTMEVTHPNPVENIIPREAPSPRQYWQAATATAGMAIAWEFWSTNTDLHTGQDTIGCYLGSWLCSHVRWQGYDADTSAWTTIATIDRTRSVAFVRTGYSVQPATTGTGGTSRYYERNELAGGYVVFPGGAVRTIASNTEGNWDAGAINEKRPVIYLERTEVDNTEDTSGTLTIVFPDSLTIAHLAGSNLYRGYRLVLHYSGSGAASPPGGKFKGGVAAIGPVVVLGKRTESQIRVAAEARVARYELPDGTERSRVIAAPRRIVSIPLGTVDLTTARGDTDPDYVRGTSTSGGEPIAHRHDLPLLLRGVIDDTDGPHVPVVWIPRVRRGTPDTYTDVLGRAGGAVYGRLEWSGYSGMLGDPEQAELVRLGEIVITEGV